MKEGRRVEEVQEVKECKEGCQDSVVSGQWPVVRSSVRNCAAKHGSFGRQSSGRQQSWRSAGRSEELAVESGSRCQSSLASNKVRNQQPVDFETRSQESVARA